MMTHRQIFNKVCDFIDGELDEATCEELKKHLAACPRCRIYVDSVRKTILLYQVKEAPRKMPAASRRRLYATIALKVKRKKKSSPPKKSKNDSALKILSLTRRAG
ncbi:MAG: zf-HC2 domain-containing protein [candidate division KSB1 bacterium]|nr:zf-HC2 domain-containing protein [candidate division KSB1 bacterium]MDZ7366697.1 zf-HC2 domain-containing protein [candidate division KSB1 bacterium]MDZ7404710.1 zf-HC2 domain-containing protein [candidate division KSB1 bacterium]